MFGKKIIKNQLPEGINTWLGYLNLMYRNNPKLRDVNSEDVNVVVSLSLKDKEGKEEHHETTLDYVHARCFYELCMYLKSIDLKEEDDDVDPHYEAYFYLKQIIEHLP